MRGEVQKHCITEGELGKSRTLEEKKSGTPMAMKIAR